METSSSPTDVVMVYYNGIHSFPSYNDNITDYGTDEQDRNDDSLYPAEKHFERCFSQPT